MTKIVALKPAKSKLDNRIYIRSMTNEEFIEKHASGTLRKNKRLGFCWKSHCLQERILFEFGGAFEALPASRVMIGDALSAPDEKGITEAGWYFDRYLSLSIFDEDVFSIKYVHATYSEQKVREGIAIVVEQTSVQWLHPGCVVFAIITEYNKYTNEWSDAVNPC